jgi:hypothetical protein
VNQYQSKGGSKNTHKSTITATIRTQAKKRVQEQNDRVTAQKRAQISLKHIEGVVAESWSCTVLLECFVYG